MTVTPAPPTLRPPVRILLVDDDEDDYHLTREVVAEIPGGGYTLDWESDFDSANDLICAAAYDVYLIDFRLGARTGLDLLRAVQERGCHEPIILLTGVSQPEVDRAAEEAGAADYLEKARLEPVLLERAIRYALRQQASEAALEQKVAERTAALLEADRRKDEFLAILAHELRNPLAPIRNGLAVLRVSNARSGDLRLEPLLDMMDRQLAHIIRLIDDLLDVSRLTTGKVVLQPSPVDVREVIEAAVEACRPHLDAGQHAIEVIVTDGALPLFGDRIRLVQVLVNLLTNASKYTPTGGRVSVNAWREGVQVVLTVTDNGIGIPAEMLPRVFDLFVQVPDHQPLAQGGLGIGLSLVKRLVEMHNGTVTVHSPGPSRGSTFTVRLPLTEQSGQCRPATAAQEPAATIGKKVLIVDDNADAAESLALMLQLMGHTTRTAGDGPSGLAAAREFTPDMAFLDIGLPGMSGHELACRLRDDPATRAAVLVALTGWGTDDDRRRSREAGFDAHLTKPVDVNAVTDLVELRPDALKRYKC
ncbi:MAG: response regulator [Fimbriiglobus sp.]|nr:response regulator [Fimbriiglobus sp.]